MNLSLPRPILGARERCEGACSACKSCAAQSLSAWSAECRCRSGPGRVWCVLRAAGPLNCVCVDCVANVVCWIGNEVPYVAFIVVCNCCIVCRKFMWVAWLLFNYDLCIDMEIISLCLSQLLLACHIKQFVCTPHNYLQVENSEKIKIKVINKNSKKKYLKKVRCRKARSEHCGRSTLANYLLNKFEWSR